MDKVNVNGPESHPVFQYLRGHTKELISKKNPSQMLELPWNFCRWVVDKDGKVQMYLDPTRQIHTCYELVEYLLDVDQDSSGTKANKKLKRSLTPLQ